MLIKKTDHPFRPFAWFGDLSDPARRRKIFGAILVFGAVAAVLGGALVLTGNDSGFMGRIKRLTASKPYMLPFNYLLGMTSKPAHMDIHIKDMDFKKLAYGRAVAMEEFYLSSKDRKEVPCLIGYNGDIVKADIRLKGNIPDHWRGDRWSFRIKLKSGNVMGMNIFSIQHPGTRDGLGEWFFKKFLEYNGLLAQRYDFIDVTLNGKHMGIYAIEEHFGKLLLTHGKRQEGPIVYYNDDLLWDSIISVKGQGSFYDYSQEAYWAGDVDGYAASKFSRDPDLKKLFQQAKDALELFRRGEIAASEVFDIKKTARLMAVCELFGSLHAHEFENAKFYYNPITHLLEPIGSDVGEYLPIDHIAGSAEKEVRETFFSTWEQRLFSDDVFFREYVKALEAIDEPGYLDTFFNNVKKEADEKLKLIHRSYPWYVFKDEDREVLYANQRFIRSILEPERGLNVFVRTPAEGDKQMILRLGNIQTMPVEVLRVTYKGTPVITSEPNMRLAGKKKDAAVDYKEIHVTLPDGEALPKDKEDGELKVEYGIPGSKRIMTQPASPWPYGDLSRTKFNPAQDMKGLGAYEFLSVKEAEKKIFFKPGTWTIKEALVLPPGYEVIAGEGVRLNLSKGAGIVSYSRLTFSGSPERPVMIYSEDKLGFGLTVFYAEGETLLRYVDFQDLSASYTETLNIEGAVMFYESPVRIEHCSFTSNHDGDSYLNIWRSKYSMEAVLFAHVKYDAFASDYSTGEIKNSAFDDIGHNAVSCAGSAIGITDVSMDNVKGSGIDCAENTSARASGIKAGNTVKLYNISEGSTLVLDGAPVAANKIKDQPDAGDLR